MKTDSQRLDVDPQVVNAILDGTWAEQRRTARALAGDPDVILPVGADLETLREATLQGVVKVAATGLPKHALPTALGGRNAHAATVAGFEEVVTASPSLQIKAGVQFGLFGGAIMHLGNAEQQQQWLEAALDAELLGCFAMTEIGHGSDVASINTTATYDADTEEFVLHTPFRAATKEYIGNAAAHGRAAVVFAQLVTAGVNHGVHAFFCPIRDEAGQTLPGVRTEDDGHKGGLLGVDNGRISFDNVRIPRTNLLNRYGDVAADGTYSSPIDSPGRRFFTMLGTLVQGRVSLDGCAVVAAKLALDIAVRYSSERRQFTGGDENEEIVLLDYQQHQRRLMPLLAETYASAVAHENLLTSFDEVFSGTDDSEENRQLLETLAAGFKADSTWRALDIIQECREACGGAGYMAENRLVGLHADLDVFVTFEGDNTVLLQLVGKRLLGDYAQEFKDIDLGGVARYLGTQAAEHSLYRSGIASIGRTISDIFTPALNQKRIRSGKVQAALLNSRVQVMVANLAQNLRPAAKMNKEAAFELFNTHQHEIIETARAYVQLQKWEAINDVLHQQTDPAMEKLFRRIRDLYGLSLIERHMDWHLMYGRMPMARARQIGETVNRLCAKLAANASDLVAAFGYGPDQRRATIAEGIEAQRQDEAREHLRRARARADHPVEEKHVNAAKKKAARDGEAEAASAS